MSANLPKDIQLKILLEENAALTQDNKRLKSENRGLLFCRDKIARGAGTASYLNNCKYCGYSFCEDDDWNPTTTCHECDDTFCSPCRDKKVYEEKTPVDYDYSDDIAFCAECLKKMDLPLNELEYTINRKPLDGFSEGRHP